LLGLLIPRVPTTEPGGVLNFVTFNSSVFIPFTLLAVLGLAEAVQLLFITVFALTPVLLTRVALLEDGVGVLIKLFAGLVAVEAPVSMPLTPPFFT